MLGVAHDAAVWRAVTKVMVWDEAGPPRAIAQVIGQSIPSATVEVAADVDELVRRCSTDRQDIAFIAVRARGERALPGVERMRRACPLTRVMAYGTRVDGVSMGKAVAAGAGGFVILDPDRVAAAPEIEKIRVPAWPPSGTQRRPLPGRAPLTLTVTERELQILRGMTDGCSNLEIAKQLFVSEDTVKTHARRLFRKLGANDRAHAVALGMRYELVG
jgi:DNA-binding NarL/FixJ family response regulator